MIITRLCVFISRYGSPHHNRSQSVKTPGRSSGRPNYLCLPQQRSRVASMPNTGVEEEYYRLRHFSITGKGVVNRGDSLKSRRSRSNNSVASSNSRYVLYIRCWSLLFRKLVCDWQADKGILSAIYFDTNHVESLWSFFFVRLIGTMHINHRELYKLLIHIGEVLYGFYIFHFWLVGCTYTYTHTNVYVYNSVKHKTRIRYSLCILKYVRPHLKWIHI